MNQLSTLQKIALYAGIISGFTNLSSLGIQVAEILSHSQQPSQAAPIVQADQQK
jgi:fluoride ion exporter CrcB/FEX